MKSIRPSKPAKEQQDFPGTAALAALRAWYAGLDARAAVAQYLGHDKATGQSSRAMLGDIRRQLARYARARHREDLAGQVEHPAAEQAQHACTVMDAIETLRHLTAPTPRVTDDVERWLPARFPAGPREPAVRRHTADLRGGQLRTVLRQFAQPGQSPLKKDPLFRQRERTERVEGSGRFRPQM